MCGTPHCISQSKLCCAQFRRSGRQPDCGAGIRMASRIAVISAITGLAFLQAVGNTSQANTSNPERYSWSDAHRGEPLDLSNNTETFSDDFNISDVTRDGGGGT